MNGDDRSSWFRYLLETRACRCRRDIHEHGTIEIEVVSIRQQPAFHVLEIGKVLARLAGFPIDVLFGASHAKRAMFAPVFPCWKRERLEMPSLRDFSREMKRVSAEIHPVFVIIIAFFARDRRGSIMILEEVIHEIATTELAC
jgi:hypothetical protein